METLLTILLFLCAVLLAIGAWYAFIHAQAKAEEAFYRQERGKMLIRLLRWHRRHARNGTSDRSAE